MIKKIVFLLMVICSLNMHLNASELVRIGAAWAFPGLLPVFSEKNLPRSQRHSFEPYKKIGLELLGAASIATVARAGSLPKLSLDALTGCLIGSTILTGVGAAIGWQYAKNFYAHSEDIERDKIYKGAYIGRTLSTIGTIGFILYKRGILTLL